MLNCASAGADVKSSRRRRVAVCAGISEMVGPLAGILPAGSTGALMTIRADPGRQPPGRRTLNREPLDARGTVTAARTSAGSNQPPPARTNQPPAAPCVLISYWSPSVANHPHGALVVS